MHIGNADVEHRIANGTLAIFEKVKLVQDAKLMPIKMHGYWVYSIGVSKVESLQLQWNNCPRFKGTFLVYPKKQVFSVNYPVTEMGLQQQMKCKMELVQFTVVQDNATTGHKLQGKSVDSIVVAEWHSVKNWAYVVISRVRTLAGLFLTSAIPADLNTKPAENYVSMRERLRSSILATPEDVVAALKATYFRSQPRDSS